MQITALKEIWKIGRVLAFWKELHQMKEAQTLVKPKMTCGDTLFHLLQDLS